jgi:MtrB/PioB family decaheme-associated outer membrane protein
MKTNPPLILIGALGALGVLAASAAMAAPGVDTSQWKCSACPEPDKGITGSVDLGAGVVSDKSAKFGDFNGLDRHGGYLIGGGELRSRSESGYYNTVNGTDLGLRSRAIKAETGQEGSFAVKFGYSEIPHSVSDSGATPFLGASSTVQTLPAGYPAATTADMPLGTTLQPVELGTKRTRYDLGAAFTGNENWTHRVVLRHDVRDGTQRIGGSFFANASQLVAPVDQITDQLEASTTFTGRGGQVTLAYQGSIFRNSAESLTWSNPFTSGALGASTGQLALAPDNQAHQVTGSGSYELSPTLRASGELSLGQMTQDAPFLAATVNSSIGPVALPSQSLHGKVDTFGASVRLTATPIDALRLNASLSRDKRDNKTPSLLYALVSTDLFLATSRTNQPYSYTTDKLKLSGDYRLSKTFKAALGFDQDNRQRTLQEVGTTHEGTVWARVSAQPLDKLGLSLKVSHADRKNGDYNPVAAIDPAENPLLRKYNLAGRQRDSFSVRADYALAEGFSLGLDGGASIDKYKQSTLGLTNGRSGNLGLDLSAAITEQTQAHVFVQAERLRSRQAGSQAFAQADWWAHSADATDVFGLGVTQSAMKGKLVLGADLVVSHSRSDVVVDTGAANPLFPKASTSLESLRLRATYQLRDNLALLGSYWYESYDTQDWRYDGVTASTIPSVLLLGEQAPHYTVNVLGVALRYRF